MFSTSNLLAHELFAFFCVRARFQISASGSLCSSKNPPHGFLSVIFW